MKNQIINVTEFRARCLRLLDDIGKNGGSITITKRGRPLAHVGPVPQTAWKSPEGAWIGKVTLTSDPLEADTGELWDALDY